MNFPKSDYTYCAHDTLEALSSPPVDFWPTYSWSWCGEILDEGIIERLDSMVARGIRRLYVLPIPQEFVSYPVPGEKPYLSEEYLAQLRFAVTEAEKRGMRVWMYDEGGWPSGAANGRVVKEHPELAAWSIDVNHDRHLIPSIVQPYPDLLNRRSTELFIEYVHEKYKKAFDNRYGEHFAVTFTDEPHVRT
ncbi:MAG: hypothetical protein IKM07_02580, partial [Clostridia bacterium]|nr:hypothetical protein [Clostridia bacterium]